jgi:hypothetical protein
MTFKKENIEGQREQEEGREIRARGKRILKEGEKGGETISPNGV